MDNYENNIEIAENKMILLYLIHKLDMIVTNIQLTNVILKNKFMNYFLMQQYLVELVNDKYLTVDEETKGFSISTNGVEMLNTLGHIMPAGIKKRIKNNATEIKRRIRNETYIEADYTPEDEYKYVVNCLIKEEDFSLIDLDLSVGSRDDAKKICRNFKKYSQQIYPEIIDILIKDREKK